MPYNSYKLAGLLTLAERRDSLIELTTHDGIKQFIQAADIPKTHSIAGISYSSIISHRLVNSKNDSLKLDSATVNSPVNVFHRDSFPLKSWELDANGNLRFIAKIARVGELTYLDAQGNPYQEHVSRECLIDSADTFKMVPVTVGSHPPEKITPRNSRRYQQGITGHTALVDSRFLWLPGVVTDEQGIQSILSGKTREISCGYDAAVKRDSQGKLHQVKRIGNHLSFIPRGRAGHEVGLNLDSIDDLDCDPPEEILKYIRV